MIQLYRAANCPACAEIETAFQELVVAYQVITVTPDQPLPELGADPLLPVIKDEGKFISGPEDIKTYLWELEQIVADWRRFQGDACYIDEAGEIC
jgi:hypothetical protein